MIGDHSASSRTPLRVSPVNPYERIVAGLTGLLRRAPEQLAIGPPLGVDEPERSTIVDVAIYDTYGTTDVEGDAGLRVVVRQ